MPAAGWWLAALLASQVLLIVGFWLWNHLHHPMGNQLVGDSTAEMLAWGRLAGLLAALACLVQVMLAARVRWIERTIAFDTLMRWHQVLGFSLVILLAAHPILVTLGHARQADLSFGAQESEFLRHWPGVLTAAIGTAILAAALALSVPPVRRRLDYEVWYAAHLTIYLALALAFGHQIAVGGDMAGHPLCRAYWLALYGFVLFNLALYRVARPLWLFWRHRFVVTALHAEAPDVTSVMIGGRSLGRFQAEAGQFVIVRFLASGFRWEEHPFSLSARPDGGQLRLTIKAVGNFTRRIPALKPGTRVFVDGPHGRLTAGRARSPKVLLIAGGIGITPLRAILEDLLAAGREAILVYAVRDRASAVFLDEMRAIEASSGGRFRVVPVMSNDIGWDGEKGRLDRARLARLVPDFAERDLFLCGPPPLMKAMRRELRVAGVPGRRIFDERFTL